jgi:hypothetical protein
MKFRIRDLIIHVISPEGPPQQEPRLQVLSAALEAGFCGGGCHCTGCTGCSGCSCTQGCTVGSGAAPFRFGFLAPQGRPSTEQALDALKTELRLRLALIEERERIVRERLRPDRG